MLVDGNVTVLVVADANTPEMYVPVIFTHGAFDTYPPLRFNAPVIDRLPVIDVFPNLSIIKLSEVAPPYPELVPKPSCPASSYIYHR